MQYKCETCYDTGSRDKLGTYLDCNACGTAATRRDLNDFVKSLGPTHPEDVALAIHQRALAMAPKQEAPTGKLGDMELNHAFDYVTKRWAYVRNEDISRSRAYFKAGYKYAFESAPHSQMSSADIAAPAAANGALTDAQIEIIGANLQAFRNKAFRLSQGQSMTLPEREGYEEQIAFARAILAAAGPDAALVKALEEVLEWYMVHGNLHHTTILCNARAALSGAKGN